MFSNICCDKPETDIIFQCRLATRLEAIAIRLEAIAISKPETRARLVVPFCSQKAFVKARMLLGAPGIATRNTVVPPAGTKTSRVLVGWTCPSSTGHCYPTQQGSVSRTRRDERGTDRASRNKCLTSSNIKLFKLFIYFNLILIAFCYYQ